MILYFENSFQKRKVIGYPKTEEEADVMMKEFLNKWGYKSRYYRSWEDNNEIHIDFGSWSEFFILDIEGKENE